MSVRTRITLAFVAVFLVCVGVNYAVERVTVLREFAKLEADGAARDADRWAQAVEREVEHLSTFVGDWAVWDDAHHFVESGDPRFIETNLASEEWFADFDVPVIRFYNVRGELVWSRTVHPKTEEPLELPELDLASAPGGVLVTGDEEQEVHGLLRTEAGLMLVASRAIVRSDGSGPAAGWMLIGRFAGEALTETLVRQAVSEGEITTLEDLWSRGDLDADTMAALVSGEPVQTQDGAIIRTYLAMHDLFGEPAIVVRSETPARISAQGRVAMWVSVISLTSAGFIALAVQLLLANRLVLRPLHRLVEHARNVKSTGDLNARFAYKSRDEIGELASEFDEMVSRLAESHSDLVARSRVVGKAEIASSVTHNLGNVLNSAVVSLEVLTQTVARMRTDGCAKAAELLETGGAGPAEGAKAAQLPRYLRSLAEALDGDRARLQEEISRVHAQLRHMSEILDAQREFAKQGEYNESVDLSAALERAVGLMALPFERHGIVLERDFAPVPHIETDPVQLLQIFVNLLTNAKESMAASPVGGRRIRLGVAQDGDRLRVTVADTGCGIAPGHLEAIFRPGYTTKQSSSGIGLHFCSIAAGQLGGTLKASSPGVGLGATFTLELPVARAPARRAAA
ncbi:MAG TPA: CHASE4 domain-containing protein [Phycisphaerales bacterium]|nr:CHASE4 domain-containing protein [Phycisphaerales bacterium]